MVYVDRRLGLGWTCRSMRRDVDALVGVWRVILEGTRTPAGSLTNLTFLVVVGNRNLRGNDRLGTIGVGHLTRNIFAFPRCARRAWSNEFLRPWISLFS